MALSTPTTTGSDSPLSTPTTTDGGGFVKSILKDLDWTSEHVGWDLSAGGDGPFTDSDGDVWTNNNAANSIAWDINSNGVVFAPSATGGSNFDTAIFLSCTPAAFASNTDYDWLIVQSYWTNTLQAGSTAGYTTAIGAAAPGTTRMDVMSYLSAGTATRNVPTVEAGAYKGNKVTAAALDELHFLELEGLGIPRRGYKATWGGSFPDILPDADWVHYSDGPGVAVADDAAAAGAFEAWSPLTGATVCAGAWQTAGTAGTMTLVRTRVVRVAFTTPARP